MATTLTASLSATAEFNNFKDSLAKSLSVTLNNLGFVSGVQNIGTTAEDVDYGDLASANVGYCFLHNQDSTNFITYGLNDSSTLKAIGKLKPGEWAFLRLKPSSQLMAQADTAACNLEFRIYRD